MRDPDALAAAVRLAEERWGGLDAAVAAAGVIAGGVPAWQVPPGQEQAVLDVDLGGVLNLARVAVPALLRRPEPRRGRFLAVASAAATRGLPMLAAYCAAKAGVAGFVRALAAELGGTGVTANAVSPGSTQTPILDESARLYGLPAAGAFAAQQPLGRLVSPAEVAAVIAFLAGDGASAMTGAVVPVDGGLALLFALLLERGVQGDVHAGERLADRAAFLGRLGGLGELLRVQAVHLAADGELDAGEPEAARRVRPERHVGLHVERLRGAAGLADQRGQLHGVAGGVGGRDELLRAGESPGVLGGPLGEGHLVGGELGTRQLDLAHALLQGPGPASACGASWHGFSSSVSIRVVFDLASVPTLDRPPPGRSRRLACMPATMKSDPDLGPTIFVLFGATGDLAKRLVLPAFYRLAQEGLLPKQWLLVGNGRGDVAHEDFRKHVRDVLSEFGPKPAKKEWKAFAERVFFAGGGFTSDSPGSLLDDLAKAREALGGDPQLVHYLAVPPVAFEELTRALGQHGLAANARVVYEKPFGTSPQSFRSLDRVVHSVLDEQQVYRIDHFLGKEATQDLHLLRFANGLFAAMWNRQHVESVQIDVPEKLGITDRSVFYDATGAVLDMLVTHLFQVAAEVAMEPPASLGALDLQAAREKVIKSFRPLDPAEVVLGQFTGYRKVPGVAAKSGQNTFVAARLWIDNPRWRGVPFYLRTGKRLAETRQRVSLILREPAGPLAGQLPGEANVLSFSLAGDGEIDLSLVAKKPGPGLDLDHGTASLPLSRLPGADPLPPYVRLIHDALIGDRSLFTRPDGLAAAWKAVAPLLIEPAAGRVLRAGLVGAGRGAQAHRAGPVAAGAVMLS